MGTFDTSSLKNLLRQAQTISATWKWADDTVNAWGSDSDFEMAFISASGLLTITDGTNTLFTFEDLGTKGKFTVDTITATTIAGITATNLVDKSGTETISGNWSFDSDIFIGVDGTVGGVVNIYGDDDVSGGQIIFHGETTGFTDNFVLLRNYTADQLILKAGSVNTLIFDNTTAIATLHNTWSLNLGAELDLTGTDAKIDLNPAGTGTANIIDITPTAALAAGSTWRAIFINPSALDPLTGSATTIYGIQVYLQDVVSADTNAKLIAYEVSPSATETTISFDTPITELDNNATQTHFLSGDVTKVLSTTATYRALNVAWGNLTRNANAPILEGIRADLPADLSNFGTSFAGYFSADGRNVTICDTTYALDVSGLSRFDNTINIDTLAEYTGAAGVTIDSLLIKDKALPNSLIVDTTGTSAITDANYNDVIAGGAAGSSEDLVTKVTLKKVLKTSNFGISGTGTPDGGGSVGNLWLEVSTDGSTWAHVTGQNEAMPGTGGTAFSFTDSTRRLSDLGETIRYRLSYEDDSDNLTISAASVTEANYSLGYILETV